MDYLWTNGSTLLIPLVVLCTIGDSTIYFTVQPKMASSSAGTNSDYPAELSSTTCPSASYMSESNAAVMVTVLLKKNNQ